MRRFVLGTAGHVDHGKTTLVRALTGIDTDRLPEEKKRGITIELGFAPWHLEEGLEVSLIDVPGHRRFVHTMIAGAIGMELVLLVVAADEGVMPQTREHVAACELLGLRRAVIAVTKVDRVGRDVAELAGEEARELLGDRWEAEVAICSARTGEGLDDVKAAVKRTLLSLAPPPRSDHARLAIDRVFSVKGAGTVVTGTLVAGKLTTGAPLFVAGATGVLTTSARGLHVHDKAVQRAEAPTRLAVNLAGLSLESVHRGDVVTDDKNAVATRMIDVALESDKPPKRGSSASLYIGTARSAAKLAPLAEEQGLTRLRLSAPMVVVGGDRFVLRGSDVDGPSGAVLGGGVVLDARPPRGRARDKRRRVLEALAKGDAVETVKALVSECSPRPLARDALGSRFTIPNAELARATDRLVGTREILRVKSGWILPDALAKLAVVARRLVADHHRGFPLDRGLALETLRRRLADLSSADVAEEAILRASDKAMKGDPIVVDADIARLLSFGAAKVVGEVAGALDLAEKLVRDAALKGVTEFGVKDATKASPREVKAILAKLVRDKLAFHAGELWFSVPAYEALRDRVKAHLEASPRLTIAEFKEMSGLGRKQAIVLLEQLDREGVTRREGDDRVRPNS